MPFTTYPGIAGKVFVPEETPRDRKHTCPDCRCCQQCGDDRCRICRTEGQDASGDTDRARCELAPPGPQDGGCH